MSTWARTGDAAPELHRYSTGPVADPDRYVVTAVDLAEVQIGGEGLLYRAWSRDTGRTVALKMLTTVPVDDFERVSDRSALLVRVRHPNLMVQVETFVGTALHDENQPAGDGEFDILYSVAEWVDGAPITDVVSDATAQQRLAWICQLASALAELAQPRPGAAAGIVHRDVKPSNVRIRSDGTAVLVDFGVARAAEPRDITDAVGTYRWRAPEVLAGTAAANRTAVDTWGLGAVAHWCFTGDPPQLDGEGPARERLAACPGLAELNDPDAVAAQVASLLASRPEDRPTDLVAWSHRLRHLAGRRSNWSRRRRSLRNAAVLGLATAAAVLSGLQVRQVLDGRAGAERTGAETAAATSSTAPPVTVACTVDTDIPVRLDPPIGHAPDPLAITLDGPPPTLWCPNLANNTTAIEQFEVTFRSISCESPVAAGYGTASLAWDDGTRAVFDVVARSTSLSSGTLELRPTSGIERTGASVGYTITPLGAGSCTDATTADRALLHLDNLTLPG